MHLVKYELFSTRILSDKIYSLISIYLQLEQFKCHPICLSSMALFWRSKYPLLPIFSVPQILDALLHCQRSLGISCRHCSETKCWLFQWGGTICNHSPSSHFSE